MPPVAGDVTDTFYEGKAFTGYGAQMMVGQGDGDATAVPPTVETFVAIPDIDKITPGDMSTGVIEKTHLRSPGRHKEKLATLRDSGAIVMSGNYRPSQGAHKQDGGDGFLPGHSLLKLWQTVAENNFRLVFPIEAGDDGGTPPAAISLDIRGTVTKYQIGELTPEGKCPFTCEITPLKDYSDGLP